ncbi:MAG: sulfur carrier protein ThiS [Rhodothermales bacterium]|nr:sulfur carrier protein ThiS [Rhodothermales bacterium]
MSEGTLHTVTVNGQSEQFDRVVSIREVLVAVGLDADEVRGVAVALNDEVIRREAWSDTSVKDGDRMEIVTAWQGG